MATIRRYFGVLGLFAAALFAPHMAHAQTAACTNDIDCPDADCGGQVCDWTTTPHSCKPAGSYPQGQDGWCTATADCKCASEGATCASVQCTRTLPKSAGDGGVAAGGASGTAGSSSTVAGSSSSGDSSSSSGCSVGGGMPRGSLGLALGATCAAVLIGARRRRREA